MFAKKIISILSFVLFIAIFGNATTYAQTQKECLDFLYKYMPLPDKVDYSQRYYENNVATTLRARQELPWGSKVPKREFMHFVLPVRVNNENLDTCRMVFYRELKDRIKNLSMSDAILEVNHWCHEKVTYTPSDERTSSPLASIRTAYGRCGEESTFLVAALRSVCIPASQVYTPRWAHTDDNHAWVEAWADGKWHFLGACEPEAVLDLGWFNAPASRGMLMTTKAFGNYDGPEEVLQRTPCFTEIDVTSNYAPVSRRFVKVINANGKAVKGATVEFKIYNYAEFYTISKKTTNRKGLTYMQAGKGDLLAWAYSGKGSKAVYGFSQCDMTANDTLIVTLNHKFGDKFSGDLHIIPPKERNTLPFVSDEMRAKNNARLAEEDSIRNSYVSSFPQTENEFVKKSRGNYAVIQHFLDNHNSAINAEKYLANLSEKDLRDIDKDVLTLSTEHIQPNLHGYPDDIYYKYVLCPRIANEALTPYMPIFRNTFGIDGISPFPSVNDIITWVKKFVKVEEKSNPQNLRMTPTGVLKSRRTDAFSRNIFFVALCRAFGFAARIDPVTQKTEYYTNTDWYPVDFGVSEVTPSSSKGILKATYTPDKYIANPKYYSHFTVSALKDGIPSLLNYAEEDTYKSTLSDGINVDAGDYLVTSGRRLADGSVLVHLEVVPVTENTTTTVPLVLPEADDVLSVIGNFNSEDIYNDETDGVKSILSTTGRGYYVLGIIAPNNEPTNHALRDIALVKDEYASLGIKTILLFHNADDASRFNSKDFPELPAGVHFGTDIDNNIWNEVSSAMHLSSSTLPVFVIADTFNRIVFISQGYTIGLGERLVKNLQSLK